MFDDNAKEGAKKKIDAKDMKLAREQTTFQIHQWVEKKQDRGGHLLESLVIGDWVVAERVSVRRGEPIGINVLIDAPVWKPLKNAFDLVTYTEGKGAKAVLKHGLKVDLKKEVFDQKTRKFVPEEPPVLVDFIGGKRGKVNYPTDFDEESAVEALIMTPDGRLQVRNSRTDSDPPLAGPDAKDERKERVAHTRRRVDEVLNPPAPAMNGGPEMPNKGGRPPGPPPMPGSKGP